MPEPQQILGTPISEVMPSIDLLSRIFLNMIYMHLTIDIADSLGTSYLHMSQPER